MPTGESERQSESRWERRQRRLAALLLLLIPLAIPAGLFAPNLVDVITADPDPFPGQGIEPDAHGVKLDHEPPTHRRDVQRNWTPPPSHTATLARLFRPAPPAEVSELPPPPRQPVEFAASDPQPELEEDFDTEPAESGELDDPNEAGDNSFPSEKEFLDGLPTFFIVDRPTAVSDAQPSAVPEPGTGLLLGTGLVALAVRRRSVRRANDLARSHPSVS